MEHNEEILNTDASTKILGTKYQEMYALSKCLDADDNSKIYLECYGDVSDGSTSVEIKSSINPDKSLYDTHIDFWKTLGNLVENHEEFSLHTEFILYTTAKVKAKSILENWNVQKAAKKRTLVLGVTPNPTINKHHQKVKSCDKNILENILDRFSIEDEQKNAEDFLADLMNHSAIKNSLPEIHRAALVERLLGYISKKLITSGQDNYRWIIDVNEFRDVLRVELKNYQIDDLIFPVIDKGSLSESGQKYRFAEELQKIKFVNAIGNAVNDYLRSELSRVYMITKRPPLSEELDNYDESIFEHMSDVHLTHSDKLRTFDSLSDDEINGRSREFFGDCLEKSKRLVVIVGVQRISDYYPKGRVHHNVETRHEFTWKLSKP